MPVTKVCIWFFHQLKLNVRTVLPKTLKLFLISKALYYSLDKKHNPCNFLFYNLWLTILLALLLNSVIHMFDTIYFICKLRDLTA